MSTRPLILIASLLPALLLPACATIISGPDQEISVISDPPGATVSADDTATYTTPATFKLTRKQEHTLLISAPGYHTQRVQVEKGFNPAFLGNILFGGIIGGVIDLISGAVVSLNPHEVHASLRRAAPGEAIKVEDWREPGTEQDAKPAAQAAPPSRPISQIPSMPLAAPSVWSVVSATPL